MDASAAGIAQDLELEQLLGHQAREQQPAFWGPWAKRPSLLLGLCGALLCATAGVVRTSPAAPAPVRDSLDSDGLVYAYAAGVSKPSYAAGVSKPCKDAIDKHTKPALLKMAKVAIDHFFECEQCMWSENCTKTTDKMLSFVVDMEKECKSSGDKCNVTEQHRPDMGPEMNVITAFCMPKECHNESDTAIKVAKKAAEKAMFKQVVRHGGNHSKGYSVNFACWGEAKKLGTHVKASSGEAST